MRWKLTIALLLSCLITQPALAASCITNYVQNSTFGSSSAWNYTPAPYYPPPHPSSTENHYARWIDPERSGVDDPCDIYFGWKMGAAWLKEPGGTVSQQFTTNAGYLGGAWSLSFEVQTQSLAGASSWDELRILVEDLTTGQAEAFSVRATQLTSTCQRFDFPLANSYANHQVRLSFNAQRYTQFDMYIDNVGFFSSKQC